MKKVSCFIVGVFLFSSSFAQKINLELNLTKGETYYQNIISNMSILQTINNQQIDMKMSIAAKMSFKVTDIQNSIYLMEVKYESMKMKINMMNREMIFDSDKKDESDIFSKIMGCLTNKPFLLKMTKTGKINEVKNVDSIFISMFEKFPQLSDAQKQQIQSQLKQSYGEKALRGNLEMATAIFPESPVTIGDSWVVNTKLESGFDANIESTYKLNASNSSYCLISGSSTIKTINKDEYIQSNGMPMKFDLTGTMSDEIKINSSTGWVMESKINQTLKGTSQIKDNPKIPGGMTIPMEMKNEMTIAEK